MKKICICLFSFILMFTFSACSSYSKPSQNAQTMEHSVAYELSKVSGADDLSDETLKALSIIIRTNLYLDSDNNSNNSQNSSNNNSEGSSITNNQDSSNSNINMSGSVNEPSINIDTNNPNIENNNNDNLINNNINNSHISENSQNNSGNSNISIENDSARLERFYNIALQTKGKILIRNKKPFRANIKYNSNNDSLKNNNSVYNLAIDKTTNNNDKNIDTNSNESDINIDDGLKNQNNLNTLKNNGNNYNVDNSKNVASNNNQTFINNNLSNNNLEDSNNLSILGASSEDEWQVVVKKSDILKYLSKNNISISNISNLKTNFSDDGHLQSITIAGKTISYSELRSVFNIKSSKITDIQNKSTVIIIRGSGEDLDDFFDIESADILAKKSNKYEELLNHFFYDYNLKTM